MSSRKGKVAGDTEEKVAGDRKSNREEKKGEKKQRKNREERVLYALKRGKKERVQQRK